jgi:tetratricopeptide (TPR) repeat protein
MYSLASSYTVLGRHADAVKLYEETLALQKARLGPDHPDTFQTMYNLAISYAELGRHADALRLREEALALHKARLGPEHPRTLMSMNSVAWSLAAVGRRAEAAKLYEETLALQRARLGTDDPDTLMSLNGLAWTYAALGRDADALALREETLTRTKARLGPDDPDTLHGMRALAESLVKLDRGAEAVPVIDDCVRRAAGKDVDPRLLTRVINLRLRHFEKTRDAAGCLQTAEMWEKLKRTDAQSLYDAACMRAVTAAVLRATDKSPGAGERADAEADRAMAWLKQAVAAGYSNAAHLLRDKDLDTLRDRADFTELVAVSQARPPEDKSAPDPGGGGGRRCAKPPPFQPVFPDLGS